MLTSFSVHNYRAFAEKQVIDIRPLTLFFGWNSGGKSALVRFLPLLAESVLVDGPPLWLAGKVGRGMTWPELVCKANQRANFEFSLSWSEPNSLSATWEVEGDAEGRWQEAVSLDLRHESRQSLFSRSELTELPWVGLSPKSGYSEESERDLSTIKQELKIIASQIQWISGVRVSPPRVAMYGGGVSPSLSSDGRDAVDHLIAAQLRSTEDPLLETVRSFFFEFGEQLILDNPMDGAWRVLLQPSNAPRVRVNLCDTGEGYSQVLPVLVALARARFGGPRFLCLEQPELHLHTKAQEKLAEQLVNTAKDPSAPRIMVETHSEVLLMSVQLAIAKGDLTPDMVRVYWVESRPDGTSDAVPVDFDEKGRPVKAMLAGAFGEVVRLAQELLTRQLPTYIQRDPS